MATDEVDVLLTVVIHRCLQAQLLVDSLIEGLAEVRYFFDEFLQFLQLQAEEDGRCDSAYAHGRLCIVQQVCFTEIFSVAQQCNTQFFSVGTFADDLCLTAGHDEEFLLVFAFLNKQLANLHLFCLERTCQTGHNLVFKVGEQGDGLQTLG